MKLTKVTIHKYKSFSSEQNFDVEDDITVLVGKNESGKTAILESIAKTNYFQEDKEFKFDETHDYPRSKLRMEIGESKLKPLAVTCTYKIDETILNEIEECLGKGTFIQKEFSVTTKYTPGRHVALIGKINMEKFINYHIPNLNKPLVIHLSNIKNQLELETLKNKLSNDEYKHAIDSLKEYFENKYVWNNPIQEYVYRIFLEPNIPKFLYYDEYYAISSEISIEKLNGGQMEKSKEKTAKAFIDLAKIDINKSINVKGDYEKHRSELDAAQLDTSNRFFKYWKTGKELKIFLDIKKNDETGEHILHIRVKHKEEGTLSLDSRSKGFKWFFSFFVWFTKIQEDKNSNYILLFDEPGLHLHASAQADFLRFLEDLSVEQGYQIIYTTHSPFMISPEKLNRVRTVVKTDEVSVISDSIQEKDNDTLVPLQAALGYDIAQNLFISQNNLLVEGLADLFVLKGISAVLRKKSRAYLNEDISIIPVGGSSRAVAFISLLRGSKLESNVVSLLDSRGVDKSGKDKLENLVANKVINKNQVQYYDHYLGDNYNEADLEDLFDKSDYVKLFNLAFKDTYPEIEQRKLNSRIKSIILQINDLIPEKCFDHCAPAQELYKTWNDASCYSETTLDNFEKVFKGVNKAFSKSRPNNKKQIDN